MYSKLSPYIKTVHVYLYQRLEIRFIFQNNTYKSVILRFLSGELDKTIRQYYIDPEADIMFCFASDLEVYHRYIFSSLYHFLLRQLRGTSKHIYLPFSLFLPEPTFFQSEFFTRKKIG